LAFLGDYAFSLGRKPAIVMEKRYAFADIEMPTNENLKL